MKNNEPARSLTTSGATASASFGIDEEDQDHIMVVLRDTLYSDKILAVLREYSANAWDAHREVGKNELPIHVTLPTLTDPTLRIRDWGPGLSPEHVLKIYTRYGKSTKRDDNNSVGQLGFGCKSAFAYTDTFTVTSWHGGFKRIYIASLNESNRGVMELKYEESLGNLAEAGVEVEVAVREEDIDEFHQRADSLFKFFVPRPVINCELPSLPDARTALTHGSIEYVNDIDENGAWTAIMGCVPYKLRLDQLKPEAFGAVWPCLRKLSGTLQFAIGDVQISPSREGLNYTKKTVAAITQKFTDLIDEYVAQTLAAVEEDGTLSDWEKRVRLVVLDTLELPLPKEWEEWAKSHVKLFDNADEVDYHMLRDGHVLTQVTISGALTFYLDDTGKELAGYSGLDTLNSYIIRRKQPDKMTVEELRTQFESLLKACNLDGAPIELLSEQTWTEPVRKGRKPTYGVRMTSPKHRATMFVLDRERALKIEVASDEWDVVTRAPEADDVFVVLQAFKARDYGRKRDTFYREYDDVAKIAKMFGRTMPKIYGYKHTPKKPVDETKLTGVEFRSWREKFLEELVAADDVTTLLRARTWEKAVDNSKPHAGNMTTLINAFGTDHDLVVLLQEIVDVLGVLEPKHERPMLDRLINDHSLTFDSPIKRRDKILRRYPIVASVGVSRLWAKSGYSYYDNSVEPVDLREYVRLIDYRDAHNICFPKEP